MKKAFDQTVREIKREVNKKVLKVPGIEQKVLDATSNEPWGPHGSHLADIAQATRNYHEYQIIMAIIWKRINDTGKNWRHVYKALTVLEYLVAHGSERVIDEIREHAYQISTLSDFQYIDSSGRDQGSNVRKKSQSLVVLVNDKERIQEVRQKAATNREKFRNTSAAGGMYRPSSYSSTGGYGDQYDDDRNEGRYGSRDEDRNGYGRESEWGSRDDDRYGRYGDSYGRDSEERYCRDGFRDDDYQGRSQGTDDYQYGSRSRSSDRDRDPPYEDDGQYSSSRGSGTRADDQPQDGSFAGNQPDRKYSEQNLGPPSYEEAVVDARSPIHNERDGETSAASVPKTSSPTASASPSHATTTSAAPAPAPAPAPAKKEVDGFDEFDPRGSVSGVPTTSNGAKMDLLGSLSESFSSNSLAIVPATSAATTEADASANSGSGPTFAAAPSASTVPNQPFQDPFGDGPFKAIPPTDGVPAQPQNVAIPYFHPSTNQSFEPPQPVTLNNFDFTDTSSFSNVHIPSTNPQLSPQELSEQNTDILADILPLSGPSATTASQADFQTGQPALQMGFPAQTGQPASQSGFPAQGVQPPSLAAFPSQTTQLALQTGFLPQTGQQPVSLAGFPPNVSQPAQMGFIAQTGERASLTGFPSQFGPPSQTGFPTPTGQPAQPSTNFYGSYGSTAPVTSHMASQTAVAPAGQHNTANILPQSGFAVPVGSQVFQTPTGPVPQNNSDILGNLLPQARPTTQMASQPASPVSLAIVPQQAREKFEPKSAVWADTLSRGLVNLNISGPKTNPLADIGIDFEAINRKEKRMEKPSAAPMTSTVTMGKAMGLGSGMGRAGASALRPATNLMMGSSMGIGMGGGPGTGVGMGMGGYGGVNRPMGMGMGMGTNMPVNMGVGINMGIGQGVQMQPPTGFPPGSTMPGGYNPMMGSGGYAPQHPYGSGYR